MFKIASDDISLHLPFCMYCPNVLHSYTCTVESFVFTFGCKYVKVQLKEKYSKLWVH